VRKDPILKKLREQFSKAVSKVYDIKGKEIKEFSCILQAYTLRWLASLSPYAPGYVLDKSSVFL